MSAIEVLSEFIFPNLAKICDGYLNDDEKHAGLMTVIENKMRHIKRSIDEFSAMNGGDRWSYGSEYKIQFCNNCESPFSEADFTNTDSDFCELCEGNGFCIDCCELVEIANDPTNSQCQNCSHKKYPDKCLTCQKNIVGKRDGPYCGIKCCFAQHVEIDINDPDFDD